MTLFKSTWLLSVPFYFMSITFSPAQTVGLNVEAQYSILTAKWLEVSTELKHYKGLSSFCVTPEFRNYTVDVMEMLHHYDSVMMEFLQEPSAIVMIGAKEHKRTMDDIRKLESGYDIKAFMAFLSESCLSRNELERNKKELQKDSGMDSYDGQVVVLETYIAKFLKHVDARVVAVDEHIHRIHPDRIGLSLVSMD